MDYGGIVVDVNQRTGNSRDFSEEDTTECVGNGGVKANEGEGSIVTFVLVENDIEILDLSAST